MVTLLKFGSHSNGKKIKWKLTFVDKFLSILVETLYGCYLYGRDHDHYAFSNFSVYLREIIDVLF